MSTKSFTNIVIIRNKTMNRLLVAKETNTQSTKISSVNFEERERQRKAAREWMSHR